MEEESNPTNNPSQNRRPELTPRKYGSRWMYTLLLIVLLFYVLLDSFFNTKETTWLNFSRNMLSTDDVEKIVIVNKEVAEVYIKKEKLGELKYEEVAKNMFGTNPGPHYSLQIGSVETFEDKIAAVHQKLPPEEWVEISYTNRVNWTNIFPWVLPVGLLVLFWMVMMGGAGRTGGKSVFSFGKSTAKLLDQNRKIKITFDDVAGLKEAIVEVKEIVDFLKSPDAYTKLGAKIPKGVMLVGPPGTGKTLMAKAVAGEAQVPFFSLSGSEFVEMFAGVGASRVRDLFKQAKDRAPSIIFIDEIDAIGRARSKSQAFQTNDERENTLNQLLTELDGFGTNTGVIVLAATNRADILDTALLRPGRFDRHVYLELPNRPERIEIFNVHLRSIKMADDVDPNLLATLTPGFSGADIANICNEAALIAARKKKERVEHQDFMEATDRIIGGLEKKSKIISRQEKEIIAHHEAGHAVASWYLENVDALVKVSIIPRGKSLGAAWYLPEEHQIITKSQFMDQICAALGGRAAEEVVFNEVSSGALDDLEKVTKQAYNMVAYYGLDKKVGHISFYDSTGQNERLLGKPYSEATAQLIDSEVRQLVTQAYEKTKGLLIEHKDELERLAQLLLKKEVIVKEDLESILGERQIKSSATS